MRVRLISSILLVSIPLVSRGIFNIFWIVFDLRDKLIIHSIHENDFRFPLYMITYYTLADLLPMGAQIISLKVAIIHFDKEYIQSEPSDRTSSINEYMLYAHNTRDSNYTCDKKGVNDSKSNFSMVNTERKYFTEDEKRLE